MTTEREPGYYWITAWEERMIAYWTPNPSGGPSGAWSCMGSDMDIPEAVITDINETPITEKI